MLQHTWEFIQAKGAFGAIPGVSTRVDSIVMLSVMLDAPRKRPSTSAVTFSSFSMDRYARALFLICLRDKPPSAIAC